ncbi:MAG: hypothetical protein ACPGUD_02645 [Parashewanella sp.]
MAGPVNRDISMLPTLLTDEQQSGSVDALDSGVDDSGRFNQVSPSLLSVNGQDFLAIKCDVNPTGVYLNETQVHQNNLTTDELQGSLSLPSTSASKPISPSPQISVREQTISRLAEHFVNVNFKSWEHFAIKIGVPFSKVYGLLPKNDKPSQSQLESLFRLCFKEFDSQGKTAADIRSSCIALLKQLKMKEKEFQQLEALHIQWY